MMKVIQRDHRLVGYKLDNVSANFITESAIKITEGKSDSEKSENSSKPEINSENSSKPEINSENSSKPEINSESVFIDIYTKSTKALEVDSYIQIMVDDGYSSSPLAENAKYYVRDIQTITEQQKGDLITYQCIKTQCSKDQVELIRDVLTNPLLKVYWTFAKDDMHHTLINKYFAEGDPKKIRQIAKYCLKDCKLVNLLLAKLEIIVNSIGMAKVCHVPLSYLFLRGQGVKIFSLVSKKCREKNYLIPVLRKEKSDNSGDDDETYEGATVITPKPDVYLSPIGVLDYSSLYPNSMRERNLTQECYLNDKKYDNLPGYIYHDVFITIKDKKGKIVRNIDGTPQKEHHRYAQEIITDEQINTELADVFAKINSECEQSIEKIKKLKTLNPDQINLILSKIKTKIEAAANGIDCSSEKSESKKNKIISSVRSKIELEYESILELDSSIKQFKAKLEEKISDLAELDPEKKKDLIAKLGEKSKVEIDNLYAEYKPSKADLDILVGFENEKAKKKISDEKAKRYNVVNGQTVRYGILPEILTELLNKRKDTNGRLACEKDPFKKAILNALQLAFKVTANSLYGQTGAPTSPIFFLPIAASTTAIGRERLYYAKKKVEENFPGSEVIYGDSVTGDTPIIYRDSNGVIHITTIEELANVWQPYDQFKAGESNRKEKQQSIVDYEIWTANGWARINRVIRHRTIKKIYRVQTNTGCIDVTEDHSLLTPDCEIIKPSECKIGTALMHSFPHQNNVINKISVGAAFDLGRQLGQIHGQVVPDTILNDNLGSKRAFVNGYIKGTGQNNQFPTFLLDSKIGAQGLYFLLKSVGYAPTISLEGESYRIDCDGYLYSGNEINVIKEIKYLDTINDNQYVYDLETADGTFHAGIGEIIVKNTDSIFINFHLKDKNGNERTDREALIETIKLCQEAAKLINDDVPKPQSIVYEKTLHPFILVAKKKYVGLLYEKNPDKYFLKSMGIVLKRRDNAPIVKIVVGGIIDHLLKNRDINKAVEYTRGVLRKLMDGGYPIDKFIISKTLKSRYKKPSTIAHKVLADRMAIRDPGNKPQINDRIPFVYVVQQASRKKKKDILQGDLIEHPDYVVKNKLEIDYLYYLEHQIINPATQILELMMPTRRVEKFFNEFIIEEQNKRIGRQAMTKWMNPKIKYSGSKTAKKESEFNKSEKSTKNSKLPVGKIKKDNKVECQSIDKWMDRKVKQNDPKTFVSKSDKKKSDPKIKQQSIDRWFDGQSDKKSECEEWSPSL